MVGIVLDMDNVSKGGMMRLNVNLNEDLERELKKIAHKRKMTLSEVINNVLLDWLEDKDYKQYKKTVRKGIRTERNAKIQS